MLAAAAGTERLFAGSLVVAAATVAALRASAPELVTLVASGEDRRHPEDHACAVYMEALMCGSTVDLVELLRPLRASRRFRLFEEGRWPGFPASDLDLALTPDRFGFAMPVGRDELGLRVDRVPV
jgi:2-phosphosulfolactate phosphatase